MSIKKKWRYWFRVIHRDFGYFFFAVTVVYSLSGIALNHIEDWDPNYEIISQEIKVNLPAQVSEMTKAQVLNILSEFGEEQNYKKHYLRRSGSLKIFLDKGNSVIINTKTGKGLIEKIRRRPIFHAVNYLHYNPGNWWKWFSDIFAVGLIIISVTGLFILKGKNGITRRGAILTIAGIIAPVLYLILFY